jgi:hypothetical protein
LSENHITEIETKQNKSVILFETRWAEVLRVFTSLADIPVRAEEGNSDHFASERGCAVTRSTPQGWVVVFAEKMRSMPEATVDAVVRHEIGHLLDLSIPTEFLDDLARSRGTVLPSTLERRADALAEWLWGDRLYYDDRLIQTLAGGTSPRPESLGL